MSNNYEIDKANENKLLIAKIEDKYNFAITRNKITYSDFLNINEISIVKRYLKEENINNYIIYGGKEETDRSIIIFYPEKFSIDMVEKNYNKILNLISIRLPNELNYEHREYLSGIMKLGIKREKFGDIIVLDDVNGADIICLSEVSKFLIDGLKELTRFRKAEITLESIDNIKDVKPNFEEVSFIVTSIRLDNFVSEIARCSRSKAEEIIESGRVFINSQNEFKTSKKININDIITVRGKGKYIFDSIERETKSGKQVVIMKKYI